MEIAQVGVRTRSRAALAMGAATSPPSSPKRRKIHNNNNNNSDSSNEKRKFSTASSSAFAQQGNRRSAGSTAELEIAADMAEPAAEERCPSPTSDEFAASCCCSNGSVGLKEERIELSDLEVESAQVETSTCNCGEEEIERREMSRRENSQEMESAETNSHHRAISTAQNMPSELELEEFFAAAEKDIQKRFQDKYNYDIAKDVPLEGRYEWVKLKP